MDDEEIEVYVKTVEPRRHDKWSFIVLSASLISEVTRIVGDHMAAATDALSEHRLHKIEERHFYEVVRGE